MNQSKKCEKTNEIISQLSYKRAQELYGERLPDIVQTRLDQELTSITKNDFSDLYLLSYNLVKRANEDGEPVYTHGLVGASLVANMLGITEINPLPPHWRCPKCHYSEFITDGSCEVGLYLQDNNCPKCGEPLIKDGHNIPSVVLLGRDGNKFPDIKIEVSERYHPVILNNYGMTLLKKLEKLTNVSYRQIPLDDSKTLSGFQYGGEFDDSDVSKDVFKLFKPKKFADIVKLFGFCHGAGVWKDNMELLIRDGKCGLDDAISVREDILAYLEQKGVDQELAVKVMESVRKGKGIKKEVAELLKSKGVPEWFIESCNKIRYLCSRAHALSSAMMAYRLAYYKVHYPEAYRLVN